MTHQDTHVSPTEAAEDVFAVAAWFNGCWNSSAQAVAPDLIEWRCRTRGSGKGRASWLDTAIFGVVAAALGLSTGNDWDGRDELIVFIPLGRAQEATELMERLGEDPESWPWFNDEVADSHDAQVDVAATVLQLPPAAVAANDDLLPALGIE